jgi:phage tail sheath protein FI
MPSYLSPGVYVQEVSSGSKPIEGVGTAVAAFVGLAQHGPVNEPTLVTNWTQFITTFGDFMPDSYLAHAVYGYFLNGGGSAYVVRIGDDDAGSEPAAKAVLPAAADNGQALTVAAIDAGPAGDEITVDVQEATEPSEGAFKLVVSRNNRIEETFDNVSSKRGAQNVVNVLKRSKLITTVEAPAALEVPLAPGRVSLTGGTGPSTVTISAEDYIGNPSDRSGFAGLEAIDEITMLSVPDAMWALQQGLLDMDGLQAVHLAMIAHCELMTDRVAILDAPPGLNAQQVKEWRVQKAGYDSKFAALYWPWIKVMDPVLGRPTFIPPSGHMAGVWARSDDTRGVHKAPANEVVRGALAPALRITRGEHDQLNPDGVNCIRSFPAGGIRVWGARTLASDPEWRYLNVRRLFNYVEQSILRGTDWVVFEPNDERLWDAVKRTVTMFLRRVWRDGALFGSTASEAFFVKCDAENNPQETRDVGQLIVDVGIAPVKPAEFVVFRISQYAGASGASE